MTFTEAEVLINDLSAKILEVCPIFGLPPTDLASATVTVSGTSAKIRFDAIDTVIDTQKICTVAGVMLRRAAGRTPETILDGDLVKDFTGEDLITYKTTDYTDSGLSSGTTYYYRFFPYSTYGVYNFHGTIKSISVP